MHGDCHAYLEEFPFDGSELVYSDPPYLHGTRKSARRYRHDYADADHVALLELLRGLPCAAMVSGYPSALYDERLSGWRSVALQVMNQAGVVTEKAWFNFAPDRVHWASLAGRNFTHRQTVKRKAAGWGRRYAAMPPAERLAVLAAIMAEEAQAPPRGTSGAAWTGCGRASRACPTRAAAATGATPWPTSAWRRCRCSSCSRRRSFRTSARRPRAVRGPTRTPCSGWSASPATTTSGTARWRAPTDPANSKRTQRNPEQQQKRQNENCCYRNGAVGAFGHGVLGLGRLRSWTSSGIAVLGDGIEAKGPRLRGMTSTSRKARLPAGDRYPAGTGSLAGIRKENCMDLDQEDARSAAELRRLEAETTKLNSEAKKLDAEVRRFRNTTIIEIVKVTGLLSGAVFAGLRALDGLGWL